MGSVTARAADQTLRLSLLYALIDGRDRIRLPHLEAALALYAHCDQTVGELYGSQQPAHSEQEGDGHAAVEDEPLHVQFLAMIREQPGVRRSELSRRWSHTPAADVQSALDLLRRYGLAYSQMQSTAGRQAECWYPVNGTKLDSSTGGGGLENDETAEGSPLPAAEENLTQATDHHIANARGSPQTTHTSSQAAEEKVQAEATCPSSSSAAASQSEVARGGAGLPVPPSPLSGGPAPPTPVGQLNKPLVRLSREQLEAGDLVPVEGEVDYMKELENLKPKR